MKHIEMNMAAPDGPDMNSYVNDKNDVALQCKSAATHRWPRTHKKT